MDNNNWDKISKELDQSGKVYLNDDFTQKVMAQIRLKKRREPVYRILKRVTPFVAVAACAIFILNIVLNGSLDTQLKLLKNQNDTAMQDEAIPENGNNLDSANRSSTIYQSYPESAADMGDDSVAQNDAMDNDAIGNEDISMKSTAYGGSVDYIESEEEVEPPILEFASPQLSPTKMRDDSFLAKNNVFMEILEQKTQNNYYKYAALVLLNTNKENVDEIAENFELEFDVIDIVNDDYYVINTTLSYDDLLVYFNILDNNPELNIFTATPDIAQIESVQYTTFANYTPSAENAIVIAGIVADTDTPLGENNKN